MYFLLLFDWAWEWAYFIKQSAQIMYNLINASILINKQKISAKHQNMQEFQQKPLQKPSGNLPKAFYAIKGLPTPISLD